MGKGISLLKGVLYAGGLRGMRLTGYERLIASGVGTPDRVPVMTQPFTYAMAMHGLSAKKFFVDSLTFTNASYNMAAYFGVDFWYPVYDVYNIEAEAMGQPLIWRENSEPDMDTRRPLVGSEDDFRRLRPPVPGRSGRMPYVLESCRRFMDIMNAPPVCVACSPFSMAVLTRGYINLLKDMRWNPGFAHRLMEFLSMEVTVPWIARMAEVTKAPLVSMSDAWASVPNVSPGMLREFCVPYVQRVIRETSTPLRTVTDTGNWGERALSDPREMLDIKVDLLDAGLRYRRFRPLSLLVWNEDYEAVGVPFVRGYAEERAVNLSLNIRPDLVHSGPPLRIAETVRGLIRDGAGDGGLVLILNLIPPGTPVENVHAAVAAVHQYGEYPIAENLDGIPFKPPRFEPFEDWVRREGLPVEG